MMLVELVDRYTQRWPWNLLVVLVVVCTSSHAAVKPVRVRVERVLTRDAYGIDTPRPLIAWDLTTPTQIGTLISHVHVAVDPDLEAVQRSIDAFVNVTQPVTPGAGFDRIRSIPQANQALAFHPVRYTGPHLSSSTKYFVSVCVRQQGTSQGMCSGTQSFVTGLIRGSAWNAQWIGGKVSLVPDQCNTCMASYKSWCPKNVASEIACGMSGIYVRSPTIKLTGSKVKSAVVHATALGMFELFVNGNPATDAVLEPGFSTNISERLLYTTYDVTKLLTTGSNNVVLAAKIGAGKYSLGFDPADWGFLAELSIVYVNGSSTSVVSGSDWVSTTSAIRYENIYRGETYDARMEILNWAVDGDVRVGGEVNNWNPVSLVSGPPEGSKITASILPPVRVTDRIVPVQAYNGANNDSIIIDLGRNIAGWVELTLSSGSIVGDRVSMIFGEVVEAGNVVNPFFQNDTYIFSGKELDGQRYAPTFVYHGFRFVQLFGKVSKCIANNGSKCITGIGIHSDVEHTGSLVFPKIDGEITEAASILQDIHTAVLQTQLDNLVSIPTDCPHREKRGWMGDAQWTAEEATLNFDMHALYVNWVQSMSDLQQKGCIKTNEQFSLEPPYGTCCSPTTNPLHPTVFQCSPMSNYSDTHGSIPDIVPMIWGNGGSRGWPGAPVWGVAFIVIPDLLRSRYADKAFLADIYPGLVAYMSFLRRQAKFAPGKILPQFGLLGDWLSLDPLCPGGSDRCLTDPGWTSGNPTTAFYYVLCVESMVEVAKFIGRATDAAAYQQELDNVRQSYFNTFFNSTTTSYGRQQTANSIGIMVGSTPLEHLGQVADALADNIKNFPSSSYGGHISTGGVGSRWILQALTAANKTEDALALATRTDNPSWGYMARSVPGTFWENWENCVGGSCNHIMLGGGIDPWIYQHVAGIKGPSTRTSIGSHFGIQRIPQNVVRMGIEGAIVDRIRACSSSISVPGGRASMDWAWRAVNTSSQAAPMVLSINVSIPVGYKSDVTIPKRVGIYTMVGNVISTENGHSTTDFDTISDFEGDNIFLAHILESGVHVISSTFR